LKLDLQTGDDTAFLELLVTQDPPVECSEMNPDYWFADPNDEEEKFGRSEAAIAQGVCNRCPIRHRCFKYALDNDIAEGIWGGFLPAQREAYKRRMRDGF